MAHLLFSLLVTFSAWAAPARGPIFSELLESAQESDWRSVEPENLLEMNLPGGRVLIELIPEFAPKTVANVKALAHENYWDELAVIRVQDNYVAQWGDPNGDQPAKRRKFKKAKEKVPAELDFALDSSLAFTKLPDADTYASETGFFKGVAAAHDQAAKKMWLLHCYGAVGVGRGNPPDSGNGGELYAVIGQAPRHLDRNVTVIGRVLQGMEVLSSLPRGHGKLGFYEKAEQNVPIRTLHLASDSPRKERVEVLRTDTPLFAKMIEARRNRVEEWFHHQAGKIDACNISVPVRAKPI